MRLGGRAQAAIEVLEDMAKRKRPVANALRDWGLSHRFAGSGDRTAIGNIVYDTLRKKSSQAAFAQSDEPRLAVFTTLIRQWRYLPDELSVLLTDDKFAPQFPAADEIKFICLDKVDDAAPATMADIPQWCTESFEANFDEEWVGEANALSERPPLDIRINTLKSNREKIAKQLSRSKAKPTTIAANGLRIAPGNRDSRLPNVQAEAGFQKGWFEIQDEGSQIVSELVYARPGEKVLDYCAGAGGKTLALAATMENRGQIHAYDNDKTRLAPIHERLKRAGTRNVQVHSPHDDLSALHEKMDKVVVDAPCTGSGTWRRRPDAKWRLTKENLETRLREQEEALSQAAQFVRPGGVLAYITCSLLPEENESQIYSFIDDNPGFELLSAGEVWQDLFGFDNLKPWSSDMKSITLTPASTQTDGFYFAVMQRNKG
ncbi:MAG: RsmB/NOP family class I SAM-dependent RNA methyltransferase [Rhizobiaceae bacterium]|nr:RsmB/NOP family class I SAM-dependent RNA methyltransferase [Rhizobiaceae bacterium]